MLRKLLIFLFGEITFEIEGGLGERFFNECVSKNLMLKKIIALPTGYKASAAYKDFKTVAKAAKKYKCSLKIIKKTGLCFLLAPYKHRYGIWLGLIAFVFLLALSRNIVWDIRFFECTQAQEAQLRHSLYEKGIYEGAIVTKKALNRIKKELVIENTAYGWVTMNYIKGRIVLEKTNATEKPTMFGKDTTNVVAAHDGIVREIDVSGGFVQVCEGQSVAKGDILVSGILLDSGGKTQKVHAEGKIYADVEKTYELTQSLEYSKEMPTGKCKSYYELRFLNMGIRLFSKLPSPPKSEQRLYRYPLVLFGFHLPATVYEYEIRELEQVDVILTQKEAEFVAREKVQNAIEEDLIDVKILSREENVENLNKKIKYTIKINARANISKIVAVN